MLKPSRAGLASAALIAAILPALQGCFPLVATGVGVATVATIDRRSYGTQVEDEQIENRAARRIADRYGDATHVNVTSFNRNVLLTGETTDEATKGNIERLAAEVPGIRGITNAIRVAPPSALTARGNDTFITSKVKANFVDQRFQANLVKVVTEGGEVYLMGLVTRGEADAATQIARTTSGVKKVVRVFEYIDEAQARALDKVSGEASGQPQR